MSDLSRNRQLRPSPGGQAASALSPIEPLIRRELARVLAQAAPNGTVPNDEDGADRLRSIEERRNRFWADPLFPGDPVGPAGADSPARAYVEGQAAILEGVLRAILTAPQRRTMFGRNNAPPAEAVEAAIALATATLLDAGRAAAEFAENAAAADEETGRNAPSDHDLALAGIEEALREIAAGDLTVRLPDLEGSYAPIATGMNAAVAKLQSALRSVAFATQSIYSGIDAISDGADDLFSRTTEQARAAERTAAAVGEITSSVRRTADAVEHARAFVTNAQSQAETSGAVVRDTISAMAQIQASVSEMSDIIGVIDGIALQTNLLALNAGVEAARAGESGRGFAVIAAEVRSLAQRSADAAKRIKELIETSRGQVASGVSLVGETGSALSRIVGQVTEMSEVVTEIAGSAVAQANGLAQVNTAISAGDTAIHQNAALAEESTATIHCLKLEAGELARLVGELRLGDLSAPGEHSLRKDQRFQRRERVSLVVSGQKRDYLMLDCSSGGARFEGRVPGPMGTQLTLMLEERALAARVVRIDAGGFAIKFQSAEARGAASEYILSGRKRARLAVVS